MVQTTFPGIYIQEFTPPSPITGVGTSTAAFIGTALKGPIGQPIEVTSFDQFTTTFGGFVTDSPGRFLAPAVYGFFHNGGTDCFIVRASTAADASAQLMDRNTANREPVIIATAITEGVAGDNLSVVVGESSYLANYLSGLPGGGSALSIHYANATIQGLSADRMTVTFTGNPTGTFRPQETVVLEDTANAVSLPYVIESVSAAPPSVTLTAAVAGSDTYANGTLRSANPAPPQTYLLVDLPANANLAQALPGGSTIEVATTEAALAGKPEYHTVTLATDGAIGPTVTLAAALANTYHLDQAVPTIGSLEFDLAVQEQGTTVESFKFLSMNQTHPNWWATSVNSTNITLSPPPAPPAHPVGDPRPEKATFPLTGGADDDRAQAWSNVLSDAGSFLDTLLASLTPYAANIISIPGATTRTAQTLLANYCQTLGNRFAVLDSEPGDSIAKVQSQVGWFGGNNSFVSLYYPWILVQSPSTGLNEYWPPSGHIAGIYAQTDQKGVHYAPANVPITLAIDVEKRLSDGDQGLLNPLGVNVLRVFPGQSTPVVWGARTPDTQNKYWQYINIRRLFIYLEQSIEEGIRWAVFQPNNETLWAQLKREIGDFLTNVWQAGALFGTKASDAFYVRIDDALNPESLRAQGQLNIEIGAAPTYPAEFIIVRIGIWQGGSQVTEG